MQPAASHESFGSFGSQALGRAGGMHEARAGPPPMVRHGMHWPLISSSPTCPPLHCIVHLHELLYIYNLNLKRSVNSGTGGNNLATTPGQRKKLIELNNPSSTSCWPVLVRAVRVPGSHTLEVAASWSHLGSTWQHYL